MSTIINNPTGSSEDSSGVGVIAGIVLTVILGILFVLYALPLLRNQATPTPTTSEIKVTLPEVPAKANTPAPTGQ